MKNAIITGVTGQDGSYLAELLLGKGYRVYGIKRRTSVDSTERIAHVLNRIELIDGDLGDSASILNAIKKVQPDEVYNLAAQSFVKTSFTEPEMTGDITGIAVIRILESIRTECPKARFYQASSSEMFGSAPPPQSELTPFHPRSPYGCAKVYGYWVTVNYREAYNMFACNGILYNHESKRRGREFVTQKIATGVAAIKAGLQKKLHLGNLDAYRDWGHAGDYVEAMWLMLQQETPDDYVIATGESHSVREFTDLAFRRVGLDYNEYVEIDPAFYRPSEVDHLRGDSSKARNKLGWVPKISFEALVNEMVDAACEKVGINTIK